MSGRCRVLTHPPVNSPHQSGPLGTIKPALTLYPPGHSCGRRFSTWSVPDGHMESQACVLPTHSHSSDADILTDHPITIPGWLFIFDLSVCLFYFIHLPSHPTRTPVLHTPQLGDGWEMPLGSGRPRRLISAGPFSTLPPAGLPFSAPQRGVRRVAGVCVCGKGEQCFIVFPCQWAVHLAVFFSPPQSILVPGFLPAENPQVALSTA